MNSTELKAHFYKRFFGVSGKLVFERAGYPVSLLGYAMSDYTDCIGAGLSMGVSVMARSTGARDITITSTSTDLCKKYPVKSKNAKDRISVFLNRAAGYKLKGGEMLADNGILAAYNSDISYSAAVASAAFKISGIASPSVVKLTELLAGENEKNAYLILFGSEKGYCARTRGYGAVKLPLPMTGYKFILASPNRRTLPMTSDSIKRAYRKIREIYPHISSFSELTEEMLLYAAPKINSKETERLVRHLIEENLRINEAEAALSGCRIKKLAEIMSGSFYSQKRILPYDNSCVFLCDLMLKTDGIIGARICDGGVIAIADTEACSWAAKMIKTSFEREFSKAPLICVADGI